MPPADLLQKLASVKSFEDAEKLGFLERATFALASAWSPNLKNPPLYLDLPIGEPQQVNAVIAQRAANAPLAMTAQYISQLKKYKAIATDVGDKDGLKVDAEIFRKQLSDVGIKNSFQIYPGDHVSGLPDRLENHALPFFNQHLKR